MSRRVEITIHTKQTLIIHGAETGRGWCPQCNREADVVTLDAARLLAGVDEATVTERLRSGGWHASIALNGSLRVCVASMLGAAPGLETIRRLNPSAAPTRIERLVLGQAWVKFQNTEGGYEACAQFDDSSAGSLALDLLGAGAAAVGKPHGSPSGEV